MKLEDQVVSLELAKRLKEIGYKQESQFYWVEYESNQNETEILLSASFDNYKSYYYLDEHETASSYKDGKPIDYELRVNSLGCGCCSGDWKVVNIYSAFTVSELGEMLPEGYRTHKERDSWYITTTHCLRCDGLDYFCSDKNEADARAKMLIHIREDLMELSK